MSMSSLSRSATAASYETRLYVSTFGTRSVILRPAYGQGAADDSILRPYAELDGLDVFVSEPASEYTSDFDLSPEELDRLARNAGKDFETALDTDEDAPTVGERVARFVREHGNDAIVLPTGSVLVGGHGTLRRADGTVETVETIDVVRSMSEARDLLGY